MQKKFKIQSLALTGNPTVEDVQGTAKKFLDDLVDSIKGQQLFNDMGVKVDKSFLLYGSPGTGKSLSIKALNNEMNKDIYFEQLINQRRAKEHKTVITPEDFELLVFPYDIGKYGTAYINEGSRTVQKFFDVAFSYANIGINTLVQLDEADCLLASRNDGLRGSSEDKKVLETIMKNMQTSKDYDNLYIVMMTNLPKLCDTAVLRAGRIDKKIEFKLPTYEERIIAYDRAIDDLNKNAKKNVIRKYDSKILSEMSKDYNYADINNVVEATVKKKALDVLHNGRKFGYVNQSMLETQCKEHYKLFKQANNIKKKNKIGF